MAKTPYQATDLVNLAGAEIVVGSATQVTAGLAQYSSIGSAISAATAGTRIIVLEGTYSESISIDKQLEIAGQGKSTIITGNITFTSGSDSSVVKFLKFNGNLTYDSGATGNTVLYCYCTTSMVFTDNDSTDSNFEHLIEE